MADNVISYKKIKRNAQKSLFLFATPGHRNVVVCHRRSTQLGLTVSWSLLVTRSEMVDDLAGQNPPIWGETDAMEPGQINASLSEAAKEAASEHRLFKRTLPQKMKARHVT